LLTHVEVGENAPAVPWLPPAATNVSYHRAYRFTAYEFDIPEADFLAWAADNGWPVAPVTEATEPAVLRRYCYDAATGEGYHRITVGYFYQHRRSNGGGVEVGYDSTEGRAYFASTPR